MAMMKRTFQLLIPYDPRGWLSIALAIFLHGFFLAYLWFGIHWQHDTPKIIVAEMWAEQAHDVAPAKNLELVTTPSVKAPQLESKESTAEKVDMTSAHETAKIDRVKADVSKNVVDHQDDPTPIAGDGATNNLQADQSNTVWVGHVMAMIMTNITYKISSYEREVNSRVEFAVKLLPDGMIAEITMTKSSGDAELDDAVLHAIEKSQPYPPDSSGSVPSNFDSVFFPVDIGRAQKQRELQDDD